MYEEEKRKHKREINITRTLSCFVYKIRRYNNYRREKYYYHLKTNARIAKSKVTNELDKETAELGTGPAQVAQGPFLISK